MLRRHLWIPAVTLAALLVVGSACGDDNSSSSSATATSSQSAATTGTSTSASGTKSTTAPSASQAVTNGLADLQKAAQDLKLIDYEVAYDSSITDAKGATSTGSMTLAHKGAKSLISIDGSFTGSGTGKTTIIDDGTSTFVCTDQGKKVCLQSKSSGATATNPFLGLATAFRADNLVSSFSKNGYDVKSVSGQTIAGRSAKCYRATGPTGSGTICLDSKNGMMLLIDGSDTTNGQTRKTVFKATQATDAPSDDAFTPPYPVQPQP